MSPARILIAALALFTLLGIQIASAQDDAPKPSDPGSVAFWNGDYAGAMQAWQSNATAGDPEAMKNIGDLYNKGLGVEQNSKQAAVWYEKSAQLGFVIAQYNLANLYYSGRGVDHDLKQAARWYRAAADGGHKMAQYYLAQMYDNGDGVPEDHTEALKWYVKAADAGLGDAQYEIARMLLTGDGLKKDPFRGAQYALKASESGNAKGQILMAKAYFKGTGVDKNLIEAYVWISIALDKLPYGQDERVARDLFDDIKAQMDDGQEAAAENELKVMRPKTPEDEEGSVGADPNATDPNATPPLTPPSE
jgi:TPR repeat protein